MDTTAKDLVPNAELIDRARSVLNPQRVQGRLFGDVAATLVTQRGAHYSGVCVDTGCGTGFCAEAAAIAAMVTASEQRIIKIVAVWRSDAGALYVLPPCGRCREFIRQMHESNIETVVVLGRDLTVSLRDLLPFSSWPDPLPMDD